MPPSIVLVHQPSILASPFRSSAAAIPATATAAAIGVTAAAVGRQGCVGQQADGGAEEQVSVRLVCPADCSGTAGGGAEVQRSDTTAGLHALKQRRGIPNPGKGSGGPCGALQVRCVDTFQQAPVRVRSWVTKGMGRLLTNAKVGTTNWVTASRKLRAGGKGQDAGFG